MTTRWTALLAAATLLLAGCDGDDDSPPPPPTPDFLQTVAGTWLTCDNDGETDFDDFMTITGTSVSGLARYHATTNETCGGAVTGIETSAASFTVGGEAPGTFRLSRRVVTARAVDVTLGDGTKFYTLLYVDTAPEPDLLYLADDPFPGDPLHDGSTPEKRHVLLNDDKPLARQPGPPTPDPFLQTLAGKWTTACVNEGFSEPAYAEDLTFTGTSVVAVTRIYATTDATCGSAPVDTQTASGGAILRGEVAATIGQGGPSVTARAVDVTFSDGGFFYSIVYVDTGANPDVLYTGDDRVDPLRDGSSPEARPIVLQDWKPRTKQP